MYLSGPRGASAIRWWVLLLAVAPAWAFDHIALGADTVETWDAGSTGVELFVGLDGIDPEKGSGSLFADYLIGLGLIENLSAHVGANLSSNDDFTKGDAGFHLGVFGTPVETDHFDLDLFLCTSASGDDLVEFAVTPSAEINLDLDRDMNKWGFYLRAGVPIIIKLGADRRDEQSRTVQGELNPGAYLTLGHGHQLLVEFDVTLRPVGADDPIDVGGFALGYNVVLTEPIELINQACLDIPVQDEQPAIGLFTGVVVTMPGSRQE